MNFRKGVVALFIVGLGVLVSPAQAQLTTFANLHTAGSALKFTNSGASSTFGTNTGLAIPVTFTYYVDNNTGLINTTIAATMTLTGHVTGGAGGFSQAMDNINMVVTADTPINGKTNLLSMLVSSGALAKGTATTATLGGTDGDGGTDTVVFTSDFLNFVGTTVRDYSITNTAISPSLTSLDPNGYMKTWLGTGTGNFSSDPAPMAFIPEPSTLALLLMGGLIPLGAGVRRTRLR